MNRYEADILMHISKNGIQNQRDISEETGYSLGTVNKAIRNLIDKGYIDNERNVQKKTKTLLEECSPTNAIILAAGYGMRMVPINTEIPKGLLSVKGEILIERTIRQLREVGIKKIYVVVGYMKETYEYLIDKLGVELIVNVDYSKKNNLHSLKLASNYIGNTYIVPCDIWCNQNPFSTHELYSWYMISEELVDHSCISINRKNEISNKAHCTFGNKMIGIAYIENGDSRIFVDNLNRMDADTKYDFSFWEDALINEKRIVLSARLENKENCIEINTYEQLREFDTDSGNLKSDAIAEICKSLNAKPKDINSIDVLKKGMTNRSFIFTCFGKRYIMRIPGEGTTELINRNNEASVYNKIMRRDICDDIVYINPDNGYKITKYLENARVCDVTNEEDILRCMNKLKEFHKMSMIVEHEFDIFGQINFYEELWKGEKSIYRDYATTKRNVFSLKTYIDANCEKKCLTHIDAVPDNFLFYNNNGKEEIKLIDWEYAGMQDPHVDIAMFCIYAMYDKRQIDKVIDIYFEENCSSEIRKKIYCYISACGLLWSNWCEYKRQLGAEFGEYSLKQYRYAKEYYLLANGDNQDE